MPIIGSSFQEALQQSTFLNYHFSRTLCSLYDGKHRLASLHCYVRKANRKHIITRFISAVVQFYFLHPRNQLYQAALFARCLCKAADVQLPAVLHEHLHPGDVQRVPQQEEQQDTPVVIPQYGSEHKEVHQQEQRTDRRTRQERLDAVMITDALQDVAHHLRVEEP